MIDRDIKAFVLKVLLAAKEPVTDDFLRNSIKTAFAHVTFTASDLKRYISECEAAGWIAGTIDDLLGLIWALTPKGKIKAQQL